ncbi:MAG TPA: hypothetical protein VGK10_12530 [Prolixibacteraceae bacterium]
MQRLLKLLSVMLLAGFISHSYASQAHSINPRILKGKCRSLVIKYFCDINRNDTLVQWERCYYIDYDSLTYDRKGNLLSACGFDSDWKTHKSIFEYDSLSNRTSTKSYDSSGSLANHTKFKYKLDDQGHVVEEISDESFSVPGDSILNRMLNTGKSKYDKNGHKTELCLSAANGKVASTIAYKYNEKNQLIEENSIISGTSITNTDYYEYDEHGNRTLWEHYNKGKLSSRNLSKYDDRNNLIEHIAFDGRDGQLLFAFRSGLKYDQNNNQTEVNFYNEKGDLLSQISYSYRYDNQGNWIECITRGQKIVRKIEYF